MYMLVLVVKIAAVASVLILGLAALLAGRRPRRAEAEPTEGPRRDVVGALVMKGFTAMFLVGVVAMFAISLLEIAAHI